MGECRFSKKAAMDLEAVAEYTIERFGIEQARRYRDDLRACFDQLLDNPRLGRRAEEFSPGLRRYEHKSHTIFYRTDDSDLFIVRVLHHRMDLARHL
jgi:toxin ParE1/3/4